MFAVMRHNPSLRCAAIAALLTILGSADVSAQMSMRGTAQEGRLMFNNSAPSSNGLACIQCHSDFDETRTNDGLIRAGHSLYNAASRLTWWGQEEEDQDRYNDISHAAVFCVEHFMRSPLKLMAQQLHRSPVVSHGDHETTPQDTPCHGAGS